MFIYIYLEMSVFKTHTQYPANFRPTQNGASATLGNCDWLDGFTESNRHGLFLAVCLKDNNILLLKWKDQT